MITLPDFHRAFDYENDFYLSCQPSRLSRIIAHYELFKMTLDVPGDIVECGVFKGTSITRFAAFRDILGDKHQKKVVGFDIFGKFPETRFDPDKAKREAFIKEAGADSISKDQLYEVFSRKNLDNVELIEGDITVTVKDYLERNPDLSISLLNSDVDIFEPTKAILETLYPRLSPGGILILDDYGNFPGETKAVDDYFGGKDVEIRTLPHCERPKYIVKKKDAI